MIQEAKDARAPIPNPAQRVTAVPTVHPSPEHTPEVPPFPHVFQHDSTTA